MVNPVRWESYQALARAARAGGDAVINPVELPHYRRPLPEVPGPWVLGFDIMKPAAVLDAARRGHAELRRHARARARSCSAAPTVWRREITCSRRWCTGSARSSSATPRRCGGSTAELRQVDLAADRRSLLPRGDRPGQPRRRPHRGLGSHHRRRHSGLRLRDPRAARIRRACVRWGFTTASAVTSRPTWRCRAR